MKLFLMLMGVLLGCIIESVFGKLCRIRREISFVVSMVTWRMLLFSKVRRMLFCRVLFYVGRKGI